MRDIAQDLKFTLRTLRRNPAFASISILTLAIGIGATTAIFSILSALLLKPYPYPEAEELVVVQMTHPGRGIDSAPLSLPDFADLREQGSGFEEIAAIDTRTFNLSGGQEPVRVEGARVTEGLFDLLGGSTVLGRTFHPEEEMGPGGRRVAVLSETLWRRSFSGREDIIGEAVRVDGEPYEVIGVVPPSAQFPDTDAAELFLPMDTRLDEARRGNRGLLVTGRLAGDAEPATMQSSMNAVAERLEEAYPDTNNGWRVAVQRLREYRTENFGSITVMVFAVVNLLLLIACFNVASLLLQRATGRHREIAMRSALGAERFRLVRQLLLESVVLALLGGLLGIALASWCLRIIVNFIPQRLPSYFEGFAIDFRVFGFMLAVSLVVALLFGLAPALRLLRLRLRSGLVEASSSAGEGGWSRLRGMLVIAEVALSVILLVGAGLMVRSLMNLGDLDPGFKRSGVLAVSLAPPASEYPETHLYKSFYDQLLTNVAVLPGVERVAATSRLPSENGARVFVELQVQTEEERQEMPSAALHLVAGDYFETLGIPALRGRAFDRRDIESAPPVAMVSAHMSETLWPGENAIGKRLRTSVNPGDPWVTVVGVVGDLELPMARRHNQLDLYLPYDQVPAVREMHVLMETAGDPLALASAARQEVQRLDRHLPVNLQSIKSVLDESFWLQELMGYLFGGFALLAMFLAAVGLYGTISYNVSLRTYEIAVRMSLGATKENLVGMVVRQVVTLTAVGLVLGLAGAFALGNVLSHFLFDVSGRDVLTFGLTTLLMLLVALLASWIPARNAAGVAPANALKAG